jgi:hypothetical protein
VKASLASIKSSAENFNEINNKDITSRLHQLTKVIVAQL